MIDEGVGKLVRENVMQNIRWDKIDMLNDCSRSELKCKSSHRCEECIFLFYFNNFVCRLVNLVRYMMEVMHRRLD